MLKLYDEEISREVSPPPHDPENKSACDLYYLHVRLFKSELRDDRLLDTDTWTLYLLNEKYTTFEGEPGSVRKLKRNSRTRTYVTGTDSERIRQAISILDGFVASAEK